MSAVLDYVQKVTPYAGKLACDVAEILERGSVNAGISWLSTVGQGRGRSLMRARRAVATELRALDLGEGERLTLTEIGCVLGGKDHTTILYYLGLKAHSYVPVAQRSASCTPI